MKVDFYLENKFNAAGLYVSRHDDCFNIMKYLDFEALILESYTQNLNQTSTYGRGPNPAPTARTFEFCVYQTKLRFILSLKCHF